MNQEEETHHAENMSEKSDADSDEESLIVSFCNHLTQNNKYEDSDILLDTGSTVSVF